MNYLEQYEKAKKEGKVQRQTYQIYTWQEKGQVLIGKVLSHSQFTGGKFDNPVNAYIIDTDDGIISTIMGSSTDEQLEAIDLPGKVVRIEFQGKKELEDGRSVNIFNVDVISASGISTPVETKGQRTVTKHGK